MVLVEVGIRTSTYSINQSELSKSSKVIKECSVLAHRHERNTVQCYIQDKFRVSRVGKQSAPYMLVLYAAELF